MKLLLENWNKFLSEEEETILREVTDDELEVVEDAIDKMAEDPKWLPFNDVFGDRTRLVIDFKSMDRESRLGRFADMLENQLGLTVDWQKGTVEATRKWDDHSRTEEAISRTVSGIMGGNMRQVQGQRHAEEIEKSFKMKIGKYLARLENLLKKLYDTKHAVVKSVTGPGAWAPHIQSLDPNQIIAAIGEDGYKRYGQLLNQLELYLGGTGGRANKFWTSEDIEEGDPVSRFSRFADFWQKNAGYIKDNVGTLTNDKYSIIITRHPLDVLRMSDFKNIVSCHSPPSQERHAQSYYKCAAAEAQGHGAVAYVVETEDLLSATNTSNIESAEQEIQEGEIFYDDKRVAHSGDIRPAARVRVRKLRYSEDADGGGQDLALPEKRIYGAGKAAGLPGIAERIRAWARSTQKTKIENLPKKDDKINLDDFKIYGGSYEDTAGPAGRLELLSLLLQKPNEDFIGDITQDTETEDDLDANVLGDIMAMYQEECESIQLEWNNRYANSVVGFEVLDDGAEGVYIRADAQMEIKWDIEEWTSLPNTWDPVINFSSAELNGIFGDVFEDDRVYFQKFDTGPGGQAEIKWSCSLDLEHPDLGGQAFMAMPDEFNDTCRMVDAFDDKRDAIKAYLSEYFKREGFMAGAEYMRLAMEIEDGEVDSLEWDTETDGEYSESYESYASYSFYYNPESWEMHPEVMFKLLDSREFKLLLRVNLLGLAQREVGTEYTLDISNTSATLVSDEIKYTIQFQVNSDDPDKRVALFRELITGVMDDEDDLKVAFNKTFAQIKKEHHGGSWSDDIQEGLDRRWVRFLLENERDRTQ